MGIIENMRLDGKAIYVTGAASGIGKCAAMAFAEAGADVAIVDIKQMRLQKRQVLRQSQLNVMLQSRIRLKQW